MNTTDPIADMLTRIRNANTSKHKTVDIPASNMKLGIAEILFKEGYIKSFEEIKDDNQGTIRVTLKYDEKGNMDILIKSFGEVNSEKKQIKLRNTIIDYSFEIKRKISTKQRASQVYPCIENTIDFFFVPYYAVIRCGKWSYLCCENRYWTGHIKKSKHCSSATHSYYYVALLRFIDYLYFCKIDN